MPTFIYFRNGTESKRVTGASSLESDIASFVAEYGKTVFETSQGKSLGATTAAPAATTTSTAAAASNQRRANNPWAQKGFNPAQAMKKNAGVEDGAAATHIDSKDDDSHATNGPDGMICEGDVCYMPGAKPKSLATASSSSSSSTDDKKPKSVCLGCSVM